MALYSICIIPTSFLTSSKTVQKSKRATDCFDATFAAIHNPLSVGSTVIGTFERSYFEDSYKISGYLRLQESSLY